MSPAGRGADARNSRTALVLTPLILGSAVSTVAVVSFLRLTQDGFGFEPGGNLPLLLATVGAHLVIAVVAATCVAAERRADPWSGLPAILLLVSTVLPVSLLHLSTDFVERSGYGRGGLDWDPLMLGPMVLLWAVFLAALVAAALSTVGRRGRAIVLRSIALAMGFILAAVVGLLSSATFAFVARARLDDAPTPPATGLLRGRLDGAIE